MEPQILVPNFLEAEKYLKEGSGIITLCGSTRFFFEFQECNLLLTTENWIVLSCGQWEHTVHKFRENLTANKNLHFHKISISDAIVVVSDETGYCGDSTKADIEFAQERKKPVFFYDGVKFSGHTHKKPPNVYEEPCQ